MRSHINSEHHHRLPQGHSYHRGVQAEGASDLISPIFPLVDDSEFRVSVSCSNPVDARVKNNRQGAPHGMSGWRLNNLDLFVLFCEQNLFRERVCTLQAGA